MSTKTVRTSAAIEGVRAYIEENVDDDVALEEKEMALRAAEEETAAAEVAAERSEALRAAAAKEAAELKAALEEAHPVLTRLKSSAADTMYGTRTACVVRPLLAERVE